MVAARNIKGERARYQACKVMHRADDVVLRARGDQNRHRNSGDLLAPERGARAGRGEPVGEKALAWARDKLGNGPILLSASDKPEAVKALQTRYGIEKSSHAIEGTMATLAKGLIAAGVGRLVVAGGEASGAVVGALDVTALRIGPEIDPGVPWTASVGAKPLLLALKSGNFGAPDFFTKAFDQL